jgi:hypothetical protein
MVRGGEGPLTSWAPPTICMIFTHPLHGSQDRFYYYQPLRKQTRPGEAQVPLNTARSDQHQGYLCFCAWQLGCPSAQPPAPTLVAVFDSHKQQQTSGFLRLGV